MAGILKPTGGEVRIGGTEITRHPGKVCNLMGLVPQDLALYSSLTVRENLVYFGRMHGLKGSDLEDAVGYCLELGSLRESAATRVARCSGGTRRRLNFVAGLIHRPEILILDEPTVGVDAQSRAVIFDGIRRLNEDGMTVVYTTHYMEEAEQLCRTVSILDLGRIMIQGTPGELVKTRDDCNDLEELFLALTGRSLRGRS
jgi:ABC-2 type transport system ATP-binding protein